MKPDKALRMADGGWRIVRQLRGAHPIPDTRYPTPDTRFSGRRGVAAVAFVAALVVIATLVLWTFQVTGTAARGSVGHLHTHATFYAAESGLEFALRELQVGSDLDGDGTMGSISNDGNSGNDPSLGQGSFSVIKTNDVLTSTAAWQSHVRVLEVTVQ